MTERLTREDVFKSLNRGLNIPTNSPYDTAHKDQTIERLISAGFDDEQILRKTYNGSPDHDTPFRTIALNRIRSLREQGVNEKATLAGEFGSLLKGEQE